VESIEAVTHAAKDYGAASFGTSALRLAPLVKEHYFGFVAESFPDLLPRYQRAYAGANAPRDYSVGLEARVNRIRSRYGFEEDEMRRPDPSVRAASGDMPAASVGQLALPL